VQPPLDGTQRHAELIGDLEQRVAADVEGVRGLAVQGLETAQGLPEPLGTLAADHGSLAGPAGAQQPGSLGRPGIREALAPGLSRTAMMKGSQSHVHSGVPAPFLGSEGAATDTRPACPLGQCAFVNRKRTHQPADRISPRPSEQDARVIAPSSWLFAAPPMTQAVWASRSVLGGRFASTAVEDVA
jgi:hypothetical protein